MRVSDVLSKSMLNLLEYLILEKTEKYYSLTELATVLKVSPSTVSKICRKLLNLNMLIERSYLKSHVGRPIKIREVNYRNPLARELAKFISNFSDYLNAEKKTANAY